MGVVIGLFLLAIVGGMTEKAFGKVAAAGVSGAKNEDGRLGHF